MDIEQLGRAIRYLTERKEDFYHAVSDPHDLTPHHMLSDYVREQGDDELADRIKTEIHRQEHLPQTIRPHRLGESASEHDFVVAALRSGHPNPTVRAMASLVSMGFPPPERMAANTERRNDLISLLLHSDPQVRPYDHDAAIAIAPNDPVRSHTAHSDLWRINTPANTEADLSAKVVRGVVYLLDGQRPDHRAYGAPSIVFEAPANDKSELEALRRHADQLRADRSPEGFGPASMGPATFTGGSNAPH